MADCLGKHPQRLLHGIRRFDLLLKQIVHLPAILRLDEKLRRIAQPSPIGKCNAQSTLRINQFSCSPMRSPETAKGRMLSTSLRINGQRLWPCTAVIGNPSASRNVGSKIDRLRQRRDPHARFLRRSASASAAAHGPVHRAATGAARRSCRARRAATPNAPSRTATDRRVLLSHANDRAACRAERRRTSPPRHRCFAAATRPLHSTSPRSSGGSVHGARPSSISSSSKYASSISSSRCQGGNRLGPSIQSHASFARDGRQHSVGELRQFFTTNDARRRCFVAVAASPGRA